MYVEVQNLLKNDEKLNILSVCMCVYGYVHFKYMCSYACMSVNKKVHPIDFCSIPNLFHLSTPFSS